MNHFYLGRWLPDIIQRVLFPLENTEAMQNKKLTAKQMPTINECRLCQRFQGTLVWNRNGEWFCIYADADVDINEEDKLGKKYFAKFEDFRKWKKKYTEDYYKLEDRTLTIDDEEEFKQVENQLREMRHLKNGYKMDSANVITING
ncbi:unnamed protein product [Ambrosiozyma monospora]|uniref:Unnamed protein product n=1 Tax=Ambrosiozyma monospora TaxID=43982 RepID=A0A9W6YX77_AMBMO|nr:unnamed protein product [Ambrosiozyma monospora]